jgi:hypothetical protein
VRPPTELAAYTSIGVAIAAAPRAVAASHCSMAEYQGTQDIEVPPVLAQLIAVNIEYKVLLYLGRGCCKAICPSRILDHICKYRHTTIKENRKQMQEYRRGFPSNYDHSTIELPADGLALQPVIPVVDRFEYRKCGIAQDDVP